MSVRSRMPKNRLVPTVVAAGAVGTVALALATTGTLSAFAASIQNSVNTSSTGTLVLQEKSSDGITCTSTDGTDNAATCSTINKYGGQVLSPGQTSTTTVTMTNLGTLTPASFTLQPGACSTTNSASGEASTTDLCSKINLAVYAGADDTGSSVFSGTLSTFTAAKKLTSLAPKASQAYTFVVSVPDLDNTYQGLTASQPLTWTMSS